MRKFISLIIFAVTAIGMSQNSKGLDEKIVAMLTKEADAVIRCHKDSSGGVGMSPKMAKRYGLPTDELLFWLKFKETVVGKNISDDKVKLKARRLDGPVFLAEGDYLVFVKKSEDDLSNWNLVADHFSEDPRPHGVK